MVVLTKARLPLPVVHRSLPDEPLPDRAALLRRLLAEDVRGVVRAVPHRGDDDIARTSTQGTGGTEEHQQQQYQYKMTHNEVVDVISGGRCVGDGSPLGPVSSTGGGFPLHPPNRNVADPVSNFHPELADAKPRGDELPGGANSAEDMAKVKGGDLLEIVTFNCSSGSGLFNFLNGPAGVVNNKVDNKDGVEVESVMEVVAVQEHHYTTDEQIDEASARLSSMGWASYWSRALRLPSGMPSGGAAVLVSKSLGSKPCSYLGDASVNIPEEFRHRVAAATVHCGEGEFDVYSLYLLDGVGMSPSNVALLSAVASVLPDRQCVLAGDYQNKPASMAEQGAFLNEAGLEVHAPPASQPTIRSNMGNYNTIDYFLCSYGVSALVETVVTKVLADFRPHRPVGLHLPRAFADSWCRTWRLPPAIPRVAVLGPRPYQSTTDYNSIRDEALELATMAAHLTDREVQVQLSALYRRWAVVAESELCGITGVSPWGSTRGRSPRLVWRRVLDLLRKLPTPTVSIAHRTRLIYHNAELVVKLVLGDDLAGAEAAWTTCTSTSDLWTEIQDEHAVQLHALLLALGFFMAESRSSVERHGHLDQDFPGWLEARGELEACIDQWAHLCRCAEAQQKMMIRRPFASGHLQPSSGVPAVPTRWVGKLTGGWRRLFPTRPPKNVSSGTLFL